MSYRTINVEGKSYEYRVGDTVIVIRDGVKRMNLRPDQEFSDLSDEYIERAIHKKYWYGFHPHHIEKLIRKHYLNQEVDMSYFDFEPQYYGNFPPTLTEVLRKQYGSHSTQNSKVAFFVGGDFNDDGGRASGYVQKLSSHIKQGLSFDDFFLFNGGHFSDLLGIVQRIEKDKPSVIFWLANVPNDKEKLVEQIKKVSPKSILISSKNNSGNRYTFPEIIARMLKIKANLSIIFHTGQAIHASLADPLGNVFLDHERHIENVADAIVNRVEDLLMTIRVGSIRIGDAIPAPQNEETLRFVEIIRRHAQEFARLTPNVSTERMLGNASFRCNFGFPSMKQDGHIFVSRRNIDKVSIDLDGFVAVEKRLTEDGVCYYGDCKPSVDTPIQQLLYEAFPKVRFMIHGHVRVKGAPETSEVVPCGAINETREIAIFMNPSKNPNFAINLRGHGCLVMAETLDYFDEVAYVGRSIRTHI